jgi:hypothetical protein
MTDSNNDNDDRQQHQKLQPRTTTAAAITINGLISESIQSILFWGCISGRVAGMDVKAGGSYVINPFFRLRFLSYICFISPSPVLNILHE